MTTSTEQKSIDWDERIVPDETAKGIVSVHLKRYVFAKDFCESKTVLDIACGSGYGTHYLAPFVKKIIGVDRSSETIEYARKRYAHPNASFEVMDACNLSFADHCFDVVCSFETIEHVEQVETYLREVVRVLKKDGLYLVSTPCVAKTTENPKNPFHFQEWSPSDFRKLLASYFESIQLFGQKRKESALHRILRKLDLWNLHAKIHAPRFTNTLSRATGTTAFAEMELSDFDIVEDDFKRADYILGIGSEFRRL